LRPPQPLATCQRPSPVFRLPCSCYRSSSPLLGQHRRAGRGMCSHRATGAAPGRSMPGPCVELLSYSASAPVAQVDRQACVSDRRPALVVQTLQKPYRDLLSSNSKTSQHMWSQIMTTCFSSRPSRETPAPLTQVASSWHCATARCATSGCKRS